MRTPLVTILDTEPERAPLEITPEGDMLNALGRVYLDAGLPLALAFEAALADYRSFDTQELVVA